jgi:glycosyltransferase involved in cell wall biosynthesis
MKGAGSSPPAVGFDRRRIGWANGTGVHRYRDGLHAAIADMAVTGLALTDAAAYGAPPGTRAVSGRGKICPSRNGRDAGEWLFPDMFRRAQSRFTITRRITEVILPDPPAIMHWSCPLPLHVRGAANIYTVHDLIPLDEGSLTSMAGRRLSHLLHQILPRAAHVTTVSEIVRSGLRARFDIAPERVTCCYEPVGPAIAEGLLPEPLVPGGYLLCLGRFEPRKNVARLIEAYLGLPRTLPLVFAGPDGDWPRARELRHVRSMIDGQRVIRIGWQSRAVVDALVTQCRALLMPSLAEGFGLPVIEAMRAGVPTMASCRGAGAEIAGGAALSVDPENVPEIAAGIASLTHDAELRDHLIRKGLERGVEFSPKVFGDRLAALYEKISGCVIRSRCDDEWGPGCA